MKKGILVVVMVTLIGGCATIKSWFANNETNLMVAVHLATAITIDKHPEWSDDIVKIVNDANLLIGDGTAVGLDALDIYIRSKITWTGMTAADQIVINDLINQIHTNIENYFITAGITDLTGQMIEVKKVLGWVLEVANTPNIVNKVKANSRRLR